MLDSGGINTVDTKGEYDVTTEATDWKNVSIGQGKSWVIVNCRSEEEARKDLEPLERV